MASPQPFPNESLSTLRELWPSSGELLAVIQAALDPAVFDQLSSELNSILQEWDDLDSTTGDPSSWKDDSYYNRSLSIIFPDGWRDPKMEGQDLIDTRALGIFGDHVTTNHIAPIGEITPASPAGKYLLENGVPQGDLNSFESRRENIHLMTRGTFGNIHLKNLMTPGIEGGFTQYFGDGPVPSPDLEIEAAKDAQPTFIFDAAIAYQQTGRKLIIIAGEDYGIGTAHDWAAKGTALLGVKAIIAKSIAPIHRAHLIGMGVLPLTFQNQEDYQKIKEMPSCTFNLTGLSGTLKTKQKATLTTSCGRNFPVLIQLETQTEIDHYLSGGVLPHILKQSLQEKASAPHCDSGTWTI